jgi:hypothetical protein
MESFSQLCKCKNSLNAFSILKDTLKPLAFQKIFQTSAKFVLNFYHRIVILDVNTLVQLKTDNTIQMITITKYSIQ